MSRFVGPMTWPRFLLGFLTLFIGTFSIAMALAMWFHLDGPGAVFGTYGFLFLVAAAGRPASIYRIVRNAGWFADIRDDRTMRLILLVLGLALLVSTPFFLHLPAHAG